MGITGFFTIFAPRKNGHKSPFIFMYNNNQKKTVKWKRFSGASYAAFQSLHREVGIGVLTVAMLSSAGLKAMAGEAGSMSVAAGARSNAGALDTAGAVGDDSLKVDVLQDVEVLATRVSLTAEQTPRMVTVLRAADIAAAAVHSVNDLLEYAVGVDVRQRGEFGVQTDVSVRGGNFDQITVLLNGVNISSPHTGHLTADFPVTALDIEQVEVLEGPAARVFGTSAFTGVINIVTRKAVVYDDDPQLFGGKAHVYGGSYGYAGGDLSLTSANSLGQNTSLTNLLTGGYSRSDGATPNSDFGSTRVFYQGSLQHKDMTVDGQFGYSYKDYGANTFYGASSTDQWESNERLIAALQMQVPLGKSWNLKAGADWNRWFDHYQWHKDSPAGENFHQVDAAAWKALINHSSAHGKTNFGYEGRFEGIYSTKLGLPLEEKEWKKTAGHDADGDIYYKYKDSRVNHNLFLEHDVLLDQWTISLGLLANSNSGLDHRWRFYPGVDIAWRPSSFWKVFASWNMALRLPTFTDLYYSGANIIGNSDLKPEKTQDVSLGVRYRRSGWHIEAQAFYSHKQDMIDWVIFNPSEKRPGEDESFADGKTFHSTNFRLDNVGIETQVDFLPRELNPESPLQKLSLQWAYLDQSSSYERSVLSSKYAMMYLRNKLVAQAETHLFSHLDLSVAWRWMDRIGEENPSYGLLDARLSWSMKRAKIYCDLTNILNKKYYEYTFVEQPGMLVKGGISVNF